MLRRPLVLVLLASTLVIGCGAAGLPPPSSFESRIAMDEAYGSRKLVADAAPADAEAMPVGLARPAAPMAPGAAPPSPSPARPLPQGAAAKGKQVSSDKPQAEEESKEHIIIYTANLALLVEPASFAASIDAMVDLSARLGGFVARHDDRTITLRVPSARFRESLRDLEKLGDVQSRSVEAQDVTEEYFDLGIRMKSLQATRRRLEELLARAANINDVLQVEEQLARVNGEVDRIEGRMRFLASHAALSTIHVSLLPRTASNLQKIVPPPPPPRTIPLPIRWLSALGVDRLLELSR